jgi:hypothetical protein
LSQLILPVEDSHASPGASPEGERRRTILVTSGRRCSALCRSSSLVGWLVRTCLDSFAGWDTSRCALIWKAQATKSGRLIFRLSRSVRHTSETASGLWPTIRSTDGDRGGRGDLLQAVRGNENKHFRLWPTPDASVANDGETLESWQARREREKAKGRNGNGFGTPLAIAVRLWPTPVSRDKRTFKGAQHMSSWTGAEGLAETVAREEATRDGALNPEWVEWLMGYPPGWTDCGVSETPSSRKSRKSSSG